MLAISSLLQNAMRPVGQTLYVWGGGWNEEDTAAGETACHVGLYADWKWFYEEKKWNYSYKPGQEAWRAGERNWRFYGLDCSGFIGWVIYNSIAQERDEKGYVFPSSDVANHLADLGYGIATKCSPDSIFRPGDIISIHGHVTMCLKQYPDRSVLLVHSTPNGGVQISGTAVGKVESTASEIAIKYMKEQYPDWWAHFGAEGKQQVDAGRFLTGIQFTWGRKE